MGTLCIDEKGINALDAKTPVYKYETSISPFFVTPHNTGYFR